MEGVIQLIWVWAVLGVVVVSYVAYRLLTDRQSNNDRHPLYPFVSRAGDGMFPRGTEKNLWVAYLFLGIGFLAFLGVIATEVFDVRSFGWLVHVAGFCIFVGAIFMGFTVLKNRGAE